MKTSELKVGELYYAEFNYGGYQVTPIEARTWTRRRVRTYRTVTEMVDPPTPFNPQTGEPNEQVERTNTVTVFKTVYEPGTVRGGSEYWGARNEVGVPCFVRGSWSVSRNAPFEPEIVRPSAIKSTWSEYVKAEREAEDAAARLAEARRVHASAIKDLNERVTRLLGDLATSQNPVTSHGGGAYVSMDALQFLVDLAECDG